MQPANESGRCRFRQVAGGMVPVDLALQPDMRPRLDLEVAALLGRIELVGERPLDLARRRVMALDQVRVVAVHHPHELGQAFRRARMQAGTQAVRRTGQRRHEIDDLRAAGIEQAGLNPSRGFFRWCQLPILKCLR